MSVEVMFRAYLQAALWSTLDDSTEHGGEPLSDAHTVDSFTAGTYERMRRDVEDFHRTHAADIGTEYDRAGRDLWLTRCGHGAGYWDGDWPEPAATRLADAARALGNVDLMVHGNQIYAGGCWS